MGIVILANLYPSVTGLAVTDILQGVMWVLMGAGLAFVILSYVYEVIPPTETALRGECNLDADGTPLP